MHNGYIQYLTCDILRDIVLLIFKNNIARLNSPWQMCLVILHQFKIKCILSYLIEFYWSLT